jgi:hypothetical protein
MVWVEEHPNLVRDARRGMIGCAVLMVLSCLVLTIPLYSLAQKGASVKAAVRASFPDFCNEWRDKIVVMPSPLGFFTTWTVSCQSGYYTDPPRAEMTVNVLMCAAHPLFTPSLKLHALYGALIAPGKKLSVCP